MNKKLENLGKEIIKIYEEGDGFLPCNRDCDCNKIRDIINKFNKNE